MKQISYWVINPFFYKIIHSDDYLKGMIKIT
jgi:hypothetical protein